MDAKENKQNGLRYFRIKTEWMAEGENGALGKTKTEELVLATSYTEAEAVAYAIAENQNRTRFGSINIEIVKTKISDVICNEILESGETLMQGLVEQYFEEGEDSGVGLYAVKIIEFILDEVTGVTKRTTETLYVPALSNADTTSRINKLLSKTLSEYVIRDVKFDKAAAIYWPVEVYQSKLRANA